MARIIKHYRKNIQRNLSDAAQKDPDVIRAFESEVEDVIDDYLRMHKIKLAKGKRRELADLILKKLSGKE